MNTRSADTNTRRYLILAVLLGNFRVSHARCGSVDYSWGADGLAEATAFVGTMMINNIVYSVTINAGLTDKLLDAVPAEQKEQMQAVISQLIDAPSYMFLLSGAERITAVMLHIALSVLVWTAVVKNKAVFYPLAIFFHALLDGVLVVLQQSGVNSILLEVILFVLTLAIAVFTYGTWKREFKNTTPAVM